MAWLLATGGVWALLGMLVLGAAPVFAGSMMSASPEDIQEVILRVKPSAVLIGVRLQGRATLSCGAGVPRTVPLPPRTRTGTGFVIHPDGYIATSGHVVGPAADGVAEEDAAALARAAVAAACANRLAGLSSPQREARVEALAKRPETRQGLQAERQVRVTFQDGKVLAANVLASRPPALRPSRTKEGAAATPPGDVAILKVDRRDLVAVPLGRVPVQIGDQVFVIGFPGAVLEHELLSPRSRLAPSVTLGRVSGFKLDLAEQEVIQTDAAIARGNSGGPAFSEKGEVIGVATFISVAGEGTEVQGFNFLIPADRVRALAATISLVPAADSGAGRRWEEAVRAFFGGRYDAAIDQLEGILRGDPDFPDARRLLAAAQARPERGSAEWGRWMQEMSGEGMQSRGGSGRGDPPGGGGPGRR